MFLLIFFFFIFLNILVEIGNISILGYFLVEIGNISILDAFPRLNISILGFFPTIPEHRRHCATSFEWRDKHGFDRSGILSGVFRRELYFAERSAFLLRSTSVVRQTDKGTPNLFVFQPNAIHPNHWHEVTF